MARDHHPSPRWDEFTTALSAALHAMPARNGGSKLMLNEQRPGGAYVGFNKDSDGLVAEIGPFPSRSAPAHLASLFSSRRRAERRRWAEFGARLATTGWTPPPWKERRDWWQGIAELASRADYDRMAAEAARVFAVELHLEPGDLTYTAFQEDPLRDLRFDGLGTARGST